MFGKKIIAGLLLALGCAVAPARAMVLQFKDDRKFLVGEVTRLAADTIEFKEETGGVWTFKLDEIEPRTLFQVRRARLADTDEVALLALADFGLENLLLTETRPVLDIVIRLRGEHQEDAYEKFDKLMNEEARLKLEKATQLTDAKEYGSARKICNEIMKEYSETSYAAYARSYIEEIIEKERLDHDAALNQQRLDEAKLKQEQEEAERRHLDDLLDDIDDLRQQAKSYRAEGLNGDTAGQWTAGIKAYEAAEKLYSQINIILQENFLKVKFQRVDYVKKAQSKEKKITKELVKCLIEHTSLLVAIPNWKQSLRTIRRALVLDPENEEAKELYKLIQENVLIKSLKDVSDPDHK